MSDTIGKFFRNPAAKPGKQAVPELSLPTPVPFEPPPVLATPADIPFQPPPTLDTPTPPPNQSAVFQETTPASVPFQAPPKLEFPTPPPVQPPPVLSVPASVPTQPPPALTAPDTIATQPPPVLSAPAVIPTEPPPVLTAPARIPLEPAPPIVVPPVIPTEPAPPLDTPAVIPFEPAPPAVVPPTVPFEPPPDLTAPSVIAFEPPPDLTAPATIPTEPPPVLTAPATIPFEPPPVLTAPSSVPLQRPPVLTAPAPVDPGPPSTQGPPYYSDSNIVNAVGGIGVNLPPPLGTIGSPIEVNVGIDRRTGLPTAKLDIHLEQIPAQIVANVESFARAQANAYAQAGLTAATTFVNNSLNKAKDAALNAALSAFGFGSGGAQSLPDLARGAPGGNLIGLPVPDPGRQPRPHEPPNPTTIEDVPLEPYDPDFTYASDSRAAVQNIQNTEALDLDAQIDEHNDWNDNFTYSEVQSQSDAIPKQLQQSFAPVQNQQNPLSSIIKSTAGADEKGYFPFEGSQLDLPDDDEVYVPLVFTDLRPANRQYRAVYFRPFIKNLSESFAPQWNLANYFGRVDPVATYKSTNRTISLGFKLTCLSPEDLAANYRKLAWLSSMCYPEYEGGAYFAGPVVRLRVGDVISAIGGATGKGISGIITALDFNFDESVWELESGMKLPRDIDVSLGFQVLHDRAIGITKTNAGMQFGGYAGGTSDIRKFRAAFGSVDYINEGVTAPKLGQVPAILPASVSSLASAGDFGALPTMPNFTDGLSPSTDVQNFPSFPDGNSDGNLGGLFS